MGIAEVIAAAKEFGIFEFYLPFMLMFVVLYGLIMKSKIFGKPEEKPAKTISLLVALFASFYVVVYTPIGITLMTFFATLFGSTLVVILSLIVFLSVLYVIMGAVKPGYEWDLSKHVGLFFLGAAILAIGVYISSGGAAIFPGIAWAPVPTVPWIVIPGLTAQHIAIIVVVLLTLGVIWWMIREKK